MTDYISRSTETLDDGPDYARVRVQPSGVYSNVYLGTQRAPSHPDEQGALCVIDIVFGDAACGRIALHKILHDKGHLRVVALPGSRP